jgi:hypothetical protein
MRGDAILRGGMVVHERNDRTQCWFPRDVAAKRFGIVRIAQEPGLGGRRARADCNSPAASKEVAGSSDLLDNPALRAIIRRRTNDPIQTIQFAPAAKYQRYGLASE